MRVHSTAEKIKKTVLFYSSSLLAQSRDIIWPLVKRKFEKPVFIVGCSRSGTTVVYKVLSMANELASLEKESHDFWNSLHPPEEKNWDSHRLDADDVSERDRVEVARYFFKYLGMRRFVDKANQNCFRIPFLAELFPDAQFLYIKRDGRDNINSLIHGWGRPDEFASWSLSMPYDVKIDQGRFRRWAFFLFPGWRAYLKASVEQVCAQQWIEANEAVLSARQTVPASQWVEICYEDILRSPADTFRTVFQKLNLTFDGAIKQCCDDLLTRPYNAFSRPRLNKWKDENRERIERIIPKINRTMRDLGYKV